MKSLFEESAREEILSRIDLVSLQSVKQWGKMDVSQMLSHCSHALEMARGTINPQRALMGKILGPLFKHKYSDDSSIGKNSPTATELITTTSSPQFDQEKSRLKELVTQFSNKGEACVTKHPHPFFGPLTPVEWGKGMYKHLDHHLKQFNA
jgi:hypothetical protein